MRARVWVRAAIAGGIALVAIAVYARRAKSDRAARIAQVNVAMACPDAQKLGPACAPCVAAYCCAELRACFGAAECIDLNDCYVSGGEGRGTGGGSGGGADARRRSEKCLAEKPGAVRSFLAWDGCARRNCEDVCPRGPEED